MKICVLGSGSKGNCTFIESGETRILIDAGFSGKEIARRLQCIDRTPEMLDAIFVTHEHNDHVAGVGVLSRRYKLPVFINNPTLHAAQKKLGTLVQQYSFQPGENLLFNGLQIHPFSVAHDAADPVGFVVRDDHATVGYCTDTGQVTKLIQHHLSRCSAIVLEANHDPEMLRNGPYPVPLKQRIQSKSGHLSNDDAIRFAVDLAEKGLNKLVLAHLSETNNDCQIVRQWVEQKLRSYRSLKVEIAAQGSPGELLSCTKSG